MAGVQKEELGTVPLGMRMRAFGPTANSPAASLALQAAGEAAWPAHAALAPAFAASPYLASLALRDPVRLARVLADPPQARLDGLIRAVEAVAQEPPAEAGRSLRLLKAELHLLTALADLGGVWDLDATTAALSRFADAAVRTALQVAVREEAARGRLLLPTPTSERGPLPGMFILALGKHGAGELNYSSDIDISVFYEPNALPTAPGVERERTALRITQAMARLLSERTADGYVFRVDLRLRPDPSSTPAAMPVEAALAYYEAVGQNWERAALIKARVVAGDVARGEAFLRALEPFVWRRALDFAAVADVHAILRQIHVRTHAGQASAARFTAPGANLKLGQGGIREIEFFAQVQQLIQGGRALALRTPRTLDALAALVAADRLDAGAARVLMEAYAKLRAWEHRAQMIADAQTHTLPTDDDARARIAALSGFGRLTDFDAEVEATLRAVSEACGALFGDDEEELTSAAGPLAFTGVEDDPATLETLALMGFAAPATVSAQVRAWHHGRIAATRTARGRELFTRLAPRLLAAAAETGAADAAFARFADFFTGLSSGVQVQSLFLAEPALFQLVVQVLALSPRLSRTLARRPVVLDALMEANFFAPVTAEGLSQVLAPALARADLGPPGLEPRMDAVRRVHGEESFRIGVQVLTGAADAPAAGRAFADLADVCLHALAPAALREVERLGGALSGGEVAVVAMGKFGGREMTATSDLDLMTVYRAPAGQASTLKGWAAETVFTRFTQRLVAALSAPTAEGGLYEVDLQLRPSGTAGPVSTPLSGLARYYAAEAQTWEFLALTRARVAWAHPPAFAQEVEAVVEAALRRPRESRGAAADVRAMRALMARERKPYGFWDMKLSPGGLVDVEFAVQHLQLIHAPHDGPLAGDTGAALQALAAAGWILAGDGAALQSAWRLQQALSQVLRLALGPRGDPTDEPPALRALLAQAGGAPDFDTLVERLSAARAAAAAAFARVTADL